MTIVGVDLSHWQGKLNDAAAQKMLRQNVRFAWVKASQGASWQDDCFANNAGVLQRNGILTGAYHFVTTDDAVSQYANFVQTMGSYAWDLPPALDCEAYTAVGVNVYAIRELETFEAAWISFSLAAVADGFRANVLPGEDTYAIWSTYGVSYPSQATADAIGRNLAAWMAKQPSLKAFTQPAIYTNQSSGNRIFTSSAMSKYPLWVANWNTAGKPPLEKPNVPAIWKGLGYLAWQDGVIKDASDYGINGALDHNVWGTLMPFPEDGEPEPEPTGEIHVTLKYPNGIVYSGKLQEA